MTISHPIASETTFRRCSSPATAETFDDLAYWQAANYLTVGQLYLRANPLLQRPLTSEDVKVVPAGPWSLSPATNLVYTQLNRLARRRLAPTLLIVGPAEATPAVLSNLWLEGTYSERFPAVERRAVGMAELFRRYGLPGGVPAELGAHVPVATAQAGWRSEILGARFALLDAAGAAMGAPSLLAACLLSEDQVQAMLLHLATDPLRSLMPGRDGRVLPIVLVREATGIRPEYLVSLLLEHGYQPLVVARDDACMLHADLGSALAEAQRRFDEEASGSDDLAPARPAVVVVSPAAFELPATDAGSALDGVTVTTATGLVLAHTHEDEVQLAAVEEWLLSYAPDEVFESDGSPAPRLEALIPAGPLRLGQFGHKLADRP